jgi:hypothetical protein
MADDLPIAAGLVHRREREVRATFCRERVQQGACAEAALVPRESVVQFR